MTTNILLAVSGNWFGVAWYWYVLALIALVLQSGFVLIRERQVGIVIKRFAAKSLPPGHLLALEGEAGYQADTLAPGLHSGYWPWQYLEFKYQDAWMEVILLECLAARFRVCLHGCFTIRKIFSIGTVVQ